MKKEWIYYEPEFACDRMEKVLLPYGPWAGLRRFGYDLITWLEPENMVELGCHYGCSTFAFLQAILDQHLPTIFYAVDTWKGDQFTGNDYREDVYGSFLKIYERCYEKTGAKIIRGTFHEASKGFGDHSVSLLHIDGSHNYDDVHRDLEEWLPKMKDDGVILMHDTADYLTCNGETLGSCRYFREICCSFPYVRELSVSCGLGIIFLSEETCRAYDENVIPEIYRHMESKYYEDAKDALRRLSFLLKSRDEWLMDLQNQNRILREQGRKLQDQMSSFHAVLEQKNNYIREIERYAHQFRHSDLRRYSGL